MKKILELCNSVVNWDRDAKHGGLLGLEVLKPQVIHLASENHDLHRKDITALFPGNNKEKRRSETWPYTPPHYFSAFSVDLIVFRIAIENTVQ